MLADDTLHLLAVGREVAVEGLEVVEGVVVRRVTSRSYSRRFINELSVKNVRNTMNATTPRNVRVT